MSKREEEKAVEAAKKVAELAKSTVDKQEAVETLQEIKQQEAAQQFQESVNTSLDQTRKNVRKSIDEARNQIPQYSDVVKSFQKQALESTGKIVEDYVEVQKSVINSVFESAIPYYENAQRMHSYLFSPKVPIELWARSAKYSGFG